MSTDNRNSVGIGQRFDFNNRSELYQSQSILLQGAPDVITRFEDDRNNILHSRAWARLRNVYQFAINYTDSRLTNRETHSIMVKDVAEEIARRLGLGRESQLLTGNIGLVHDIGHPPFSHWGQLAIKKALNPHGLDWNHDTAGLRIMTEWSKDVQILSPTFVEGMAKRFWRYEQSKPCSFYNHDMAELPDKVIKIDKAHDGVIKFNVFNHIEGQIAAQSDRLAFNVTDLKDGLRIGRFQLQMIQNEFPFAWNILDKTINEFVDQYTAIFPYDRNIELLRKLVCDDKDIMGFIYQKFAGSFREALLQDLLDNTKENLEKLIDSELVKNAEDIRNAENVVVEFSPKLNEQFKKYARFCREHIFTTTAPFEHLVSAMINDYITEKVHLPLTWQSEFNQMQTIGERIELIAKYLTCEITDCDVINHIRKYSPCVTNEQVPRFESIQDNDISFHTALKRLNELKRRVSKERIGISIISPEQLSFNDEKSILVISVAQKFILCVPEIGETIQITEDGKYKSGEEFHCGDPILSGKNIISGNGIAFYNASGDQWVAAISGLQGDNRHVIILNEVNEAQAQQLQSKVNEFGDPEKITISQLKQILSYADSLKLIDRYPSNVAFVNEMMESVLGDDKIYGWKQRKQTQICRVTAAVGDGELHHPFGESEKFYDGTLIVQHPDGSIHVVDKDIACRTYFHLDKNCIEKETIPLQKSFAKHEFQTTHELPSDIDSTHVIIVGGGISGIMSATYIIQEFLKINPINYALEVTIIDSISQPGGSTYNRPPCAKLPMANSIEILGIESAMGCIEYINRDPEKWRSVFSDASYVEGKGFDPTASVSYAQFGEYVCDHLQSLLKHLESKKALVKFQFVRDRVISSTDDEDANECVVTLGSGREISSDAVVYALGNAHPKPLKDIHGKELCGINGYYNLDDHAFTQENVNETDFTVTVGTGNGACFSSLAAINNGYKGKFLLVSRNGEVPQVADQSKPYTRTICTLQNIETEIKGIEDLTADYLKKLFEREMIAARKEGFEWRDVVDSMFPDTNTLWRAMSKVEQQSFVEKYGMSWNLARYRIPNVQWENINALRKEGRLEISGGLQSIEIATPTGFNLAIKDQDGSIRTVHTKKLVNNTGPSKHLEQMPKCAKDLVAKGLARMHPCGGLDVDDHSRLINAKGETSSRRYALGPTVIGAFYESVTIPAIRSNVPIMSKALIQDHIVFESAGLHYSGYDHRPHDYSTMAPENLEDAFKKTCFARSLTNIYPRHYTKEEKDKFYTTEFAEKALSSGQISAPPSRTVLWSGGYIPSHPLGYGLSRIIVEHWLVEQNAKVESNDEGKFTSADLYHTVAMTEAGLPVLNPMWDDLTIPYSVKKDVTPIYILGFAACATGEITLNVDDTDIDSFFRQNELKVIMENQNITSVRVIRIKPRIDILEEILYADRHKWYNQQKNQWVTSIINRYQLAKKKKDRRHSNCVLYQRMSKALLEELHDSYLNMINGNQFIQGFHEAMGIQYQPETQQEDAQFEKVRLENFTPLIQATPDLLNHETLDSEHLRIDLRRFFANKQSNEH